MQTISYRNDLLIFIHTTDPDGSVHNSSIIYASEGDLFFNISNSNFFICLQGGVSDQIWEQITYVSLVESLIAAIPQADWTESSPSASNYIQNKPSIPAAQVNSDWNAVSGLAQILNKPSIPAAQIQSDWTQASSGAVDFIKNKPAARSQSSASRSLNTIFQINATRDCIVNYSVDISCTLSLTTGQSGTVFLEIASNSGFTTNVQELARFVNGNTGTLTIGLALTQNVTGTLSGYVPTGYYVRLRTVNNTGTPTITYRSGQEVLL